VLSVIVHPSHTIEKSGTPPEGTRVITERKLKALKLAVRTYARALAQDDQYRLPASVDQQFRHHKLTAGSILSEFTRERPPGAQEAGMTASAISRPAVP
jgi:hypothetical protein